MSYVRPQMLVIRLRQRLFLGHLYLQARPGLLLQIPYYTTDFAILDSAQ